MQQLDHPAKPDPQPVNPVVQQLRRPAGPDALATLRRYLMMRPVMFGSLLVLLVLHWAAPSAFDLETLVLLLGIYLLAVGTGGLEAARLSGTGGDRRRHERLAEDALRRAGRLQSHLDPCSATDDVVNRILAASHDSRHMVVLAGNEVEDALRAVYRHYSEAERMAGTSNGTDIPLVFQTQELIYRGLLPPDVYETAEPILTLREIAEEPRSQISQQVATDVARATQAIVLRVQSLGIKIHPTRVPLAWLRSDTDDDEAKQESAPDPELKASEAPRPDTGDGASGERFTVSTPMLKERVAAEAVRRDLRPRQGVQEPTDSLP